MAATAIEGEIGRYPPRLRVPVGRQRRILRAYSLAKPDATAAEQRRHALEADAADWVRCSCLAAWREGSMTPGVSNCAPSWLACQDGFPPYQALRASLSVPYACLKDLAWGNDLTYPSGRYFSSGMEIEEFLDQSGLKEKGREMISSVGRAKQRVAGAPGDCLVRSEIPAICDEILQAVTVASFGASNPKQ